MADVETGLKWWIRYAAVPIVAGGGVIALLVGLFRSEGTQKPQPIEITVAAPQLPAAQPASQPISQPASQPASAAPALGPQTAERSTVEKARLNITVDPDTIGIEIGKHSAVAYRFREVGGVGATIETQDVRWVLPNGDELYAEKGTRILGGSFSVRALGAHDLLDNVYLPPHIASATFERGMSQVQLETSFIATDFNDQMVRAKAVLRIGILAPQ